MKLEKERGGLTRRAKRADQLEVEVKRLRNELLSMQGESAKAFERGKREGVRERPIDSADGDTVEMATFVAVSQELEMAQTKLGQVRADLEQERKRNMRLHRMRMAAEQEIDKAKDTINFLSADLRRQEQSCFEPLRSEQAGRKIFPSAAAESSSSSSSRL